MPTAEAETPANLTRPTAFSCGPSREYPFRSLFIITTMFHESILQLQIACIPSNNNCPFLTPATIMVQEHRLFPMNFSKEYTHTESLFVPLQITHSIPWSFLSPSLFRERGSNLISRYLVMTLLLLSFLLLPPPSILAISAIQTCTIAV